jgi:uncharacterized protein YbjT (DUF2867 family)
MTWILILGANGQLARNTTRFILERSDARVTLYLRRANRLSNPNPARAGPRRRRAGPGGLGGSHAGPGRGLRPASVKRLIFISFMGIYSEVPGEKYRSVLDAHRDSAAVIEASDLDYTILRPAWFTHDDRID